MRSKRSSETQVQAPEAGTFSELVKTARAKNFVGREAELQLLLRHLENREAGPRVHFVCGPGGIGKSALLGALEQRCRRAKLAVRSFDARNPRYSSASASLFESISRDLDAEPNRQLVVLVDNLPPGEPERWLFEQGAHRVPAYLQFVLARRQPPGPSQLTDYGLDLVTVLALRGLRREESAHYLSLRGVEQDHDALHRMTGGYPLALALAAETGASGSGHELPFTVIEALLERLREELPSPRHQEALEVAAVVRITHEPLLRRLLRTERADEAAQMFSWLAGLSFVELTTEGLRPHDVIRTALRGALLARDPTRYRQYYDRAQSWYLEELAKNQDQPHGASAEQATMGLAFLHHANQIGRDYMALEDSDVPRVVPASTAEDLHTAREMVLRHQGAQAAECFDYWAARQDDQVFVCRNGAGEAIGMLQYLLLEERNRDEAQNDPCTRCVFEWIDGAGPLRGDERVLLTRFWMDAENHQQVSTVASHMWLHTAVQYGLTPRLAWGIACFAEPDVWAPPFQYMEFQRAEGATFEQGGHHFGFFAHDWRRRPVEAWFEMLASRRLDPAASDAAAAHNVLVLDRKAFEVAVRAALKTYSRDVELERNPLLASPLVVARVGQKGSASATARLKALRELISEGAASLSGSVRGDKMHEVLRATYLEPRGVQERVAEDLDLAFTTYRRYLTKAVVQVIDWLWDRETGVQPFGIDR